MLWFPAIVLRQRAAVIDVARTLEGVDGWRLMELLRDHKAGVEGICGGQCDCASCHVHVAPEWLDRLPGPRDEEEGKLDELPGWAETSRLSCQIIWGEDLDGLALTEGDSVFLGLCGWVRDLRKATVAMTPEEAGVLEAAGIEGEEGNLVVGPYLVEVALEAGHPVPLLRREQIRAGGLPTIPFGVDALPAERRAA